MLNGDDGKQSIFWIINAGIVCSFMIHFFTLHCRRHDHQDGDSNDSSMYPEIDMLVASYYSSFGANIDRQHFELAIKQSSRERVSRGATAIVQVISGNIYVDLTSFTTPYSWDRLRLQHTLAMLKRVIEQDQVNNFEMIVNVHDCPMRETVMHQVPVFAMTRCKNSNAIPLPQWYRMRDGKWSDWNAFIDKNLNMKPGNTERAQKAVFRGAFRPSIINNSQQNLSFVNITKDNWRLYGRSKLLHLQSQHPHLYDIGLFTSSPKEWQFISEQVQGNKGNKLSMKQQVQNYKYVIHVEGACGWADRLKVFLALGAALLKQDAVCGEFFEPLLRPWVHFIPIDNNLNNLTDSIVNVDDETVGFIRQNALYFADRHLRSEAWEYYFNKVIRRYAKMWTKETIQQRPGSKKFINEATCKSHNQCDDSAAYE